MPLATFPFGCMTIRELGRRQAAEWRLLRNDGLVWRLLVGLNHKLIQRIDLLCVPYLVIEELNHRKPYNFSLALAIGYLSYWSFKIIDGFDFQWMSLGQFFDVQSSDQKCDILKNTHCSST
jgi:hypothetical protein